MEVGGRSRLFVDPHKTPCCQKTYCNNCITDALIESDFVCPACGQDEVLIDDLKPDDETAAKLAEFVKYWDDKMKEKKDEGDDAAAAAAAATNGDGATGSPPKTAALVVATSNGDRSGSSTPT